MSIEKNYEIFKRPSSHVNLWSVHSPFISGIVLSLSLSLKSQISMRTSASPRRLEGINPCGFRSSPTAYHILQGGSILFFRRDEPRLCLCLTVLRKIGFKRFLCLSMENIYIDIYDVITQMKSVTDLPRPASSR